MYKLKDIVKSFLTAHLAAISSGLLFAVLWLKPTLGGLTYGNLDPSFIYGVEKAAASGVSFGDKFISTYGPLSYAVTNYVASNIYKVIVFELLTVLVVGFGIEWFGRLYLKGDTRTRITMSILLVLSLSVCNTERLYLNLFVLYLFIYVKHNDKTKHNMSLCLAAVSALFTLMKFTIGFGSLAALILAIVFATPLPLNKQAIYKRTKQLLKPGAVYLLVLTSLGFLLGIHNIVAYIFNSLLMSAGFSNAMSYVDPSIAVATKYLAFSIMLLLIWLIVKCKQKAFNYAFLLPVLYVFWKYCIVRQDGHILAIVEVIPFMSLMIYMVSKKTKYYDGPFLAVIIAASFIAIWANAITITDFVTALNRPLDNLRHHRITAFFNVPYQQRNWDWEVSAHLQAAKLPATMRTKIGNNGVDVFPWEAVIVQINNLHWQNRPSPFSFETYTPQFDNDNAEFFAKRGPEYIIWHSFGINGIQGVDGRNILWDEPETLKNILANYKYVESNQQFILLKRLARPTQAALTSSQPTLHIGLRTVAVPLTNNLECLSLGVNNNILETIKGIAVRERPFNINVHYESGAIYKTRFVRETAGDGLLINQMPKNWDELKELLKYHHTSDLVQSISIDTEPSTKVSFSDCLGNT